MGAYTEKLTELENELSQRKEERVRKKEVINQLRSFLQKFGYNSDREINSEIEQLAHQVKTLQLKRSKIKKGYDEDTHFVDELREKLQRLENKLHLENQVRNDLDRKINEQRALKNELITTKFKLARSKSSRAVLADIPFEYCPNCGTKIDHSRLSQSVCSLCGQYPSKTNDTLLEEEVVRRDLDSRIKELEEQITRHKNAQFMQKRILSNLKEEKEILDKQLEDELRTYDSRYLSRSREIERSIASYEERIRGLKKILEMPIAVTNLEEEVDELIGAEEKLKRGIEKEKETLIASEKYIHEIEKAYHKILLEVGVPGVRTNDRVEINRKTWIPEILTGGDKTRKWNFYNAGSAGKKTLLNVCYALAIHKVAADYNLMLPTLLIIDTPMKNIGEDVNRDLFEAFYSSLYSLAQGSLANTQFMIIDKEFFPPKSKVINISERFMSVESSDHPPLISYYRGP